MLLKKQIRRSGSRASLQGVNRTSSSTDLRASRKDRSRVRRSKSSQSMLRTYSSPQTTSTNPLQMASPLERTHSERYLLSPDHHVVKMDDDTTDDVSPMTDDSRATSTTRRRRRARRLANRRSSLDDVSSCASSSVTSESLCGTSERRRSIQASSPASTAASAAEGGQTRVGSGGGRRRPVQRTRSKDFSQSLIGAASLQYHHHHHHHPCQRNQNSKTLINSKNPYSDAMNDVSCNSQMDREPMSGESLHTTLARLKQLTKHHHQTPPTKTSLKSKSLQQVCTSKTA